MHFQTDTQKTQRIRDSNVTTEAEIGVMWPQARNMAVSRAWKRQRKECPFGPLEGAGSH